LSRVKWYYYVAVYSGTQTCSANPTIKEEKKRTDNKLTTKQNYGILALIPLLTFLALRLGSGLYFTICGESSPSSFVPHEAALMFGIAAALLMGAGKFEEETESFIRHAVSPTLKCISAAGGSTAATDWCSKASRTPLTISTVSTARNEGN